MAQHITSADHVASSDDDWFAPKPTCRPAVILGPSRRAQGELFALTLLPRQLPVFRHGPEDSIH